jgi:hypothetical protein
MPVIYRPIVSDPEHPQRRRIAFCTTMGIAIKKGQPDSAAEVWREPSYQHLYSPTITPLELDDLNRFPWKQVTNVRISPADGSIELRFYGRWVCVTSEYGDIRYDRSYMTSANDEIKMAKPLQASIRRMLHKQKVERCTAAAMGLHSRLGDCSAMRVLSCQLMELIVSYI